MLKLRRVQDLLSQKMQKPASLEEVLESMAEQFIQKHDPVKKAERQEMRGKLMEAVTQVPNQQVPGPVLKATALKRNPLKSVTRHRVFLKHKGQCAYTHQDGHRCPEKRHLEIHHLVPVAQGGSDESSNLTLLCFGHHRGQHL